MTIADTDNYLSQFLGSDIPGGCDDCPAVQRLHQHDTGIWRLQVMHDDECLTLQRMHRSSSP